MVYFYGHEDEAPVLAYLKRTFTDNEVFRNTSKMSVVIHLREILVLNNTKCIK